MARALTRRRILKIAKNHYYAKCDFRPCSHVMASGAETSTKADTLPVTSGVAMSTEADTQPVCSIHEQFN